ncbi:hypothetical protein SLA2020_066330 [Shorea laevis]
MRLVQDTASEVQEDEDTRECKKLSQNMKFFLSREVPRESLLFVIPAFGGVVSWEGDGAPFKEADSSITHQGHKYLSREYIQPQWVFDCVNAWIILLTEAYMVGRVPPPHLSLFVDDEAEGYVPNHAKTIKQLQGAARNDVLPLPGMGKDDMDDPQHLLAEGYINRTEANEAAEKKCKMMLYEKQYHNELKMEIQGDLNINQQSSKEMDSKEESLPYMEQIANDADAHSKALMSRRERGLYEAIRIGKKRKEAHVEKLKERKRNIQEAQKSEKKQRSA